MLPSPATIRWSSSSSFTAARPSRRTRCLSQWPSMAPSSGSGPSAANAGQSVEFARSAPGRSSRTGADRAGASRLPSSVSISRWSCLPSSSGSTRQAPDMPRWKISVSPRSVSISPYLARRPSEVTRAPVSRWPRSAGNGAAQIGAARLDPLTGAGPSGHAQARAPWFRLRAARAWGIPSLNSGVPRL